MRTIQASRRPAAIVAREDGIQQNSGGGRKRKGGDPESHCRILDADTSDMGADEEVS